MSNKGKAVFDSVEIGDKKYVIYGASSRGGDFDKGWVPYPIRLLEMPADMPIYDDFRCSMKGVTVLRKEAANMLSTFGPNSKPAGIINEMRQDILDIASPTDPLLRNSVRLVFAVNDYSLEAVKALIPVCDPTFGRSQALRKAAKSYNFEMVEALIPCSDVKANDSEALRNAVDSRLLGGNPEMVQMLLPHSDVKARDSEALYTAVKRGCWNIAEMLILHSEPSAWSEGRWNSLSNEDRFKVYELEAKCDRDRLNKALPGVTELTPEQRAEMFEDVSRQATEIRHGGSIQPARQAQAITQSRSRGRL